LDIQSKINNGEYQSLLWGMLKGEHVDLDMPRYTLLEEGLDEFQTSFRSLGFELIHDMSSGFFYLQREKLVDSAEKRTANQISTIFFIIVQVLQDQESNKSTIDLPYLLNHNGFHLEHILSKSTLPNHLSRIMNGIGIREDEDVLKVLTRMQSVNLIEKLSGTGIWRFRRSIARLEQLARTYAGEDEAE